MKVTQKKWIVFSGTVLAILLVYLHAPLPQPLSFHNFADKRPFLGIPNFGNVMSNM